MIDVDRILSIDLCRALLRNLRRALSPDLCCALLPDFCHVLSPDFSLRWMTLLWCYDLCANVTIGLLAAAASPRVATVHCRAIATGLLVRTYFLECWKLCPLHRT